MIQMPIRSPASDDPLWTEVQGMRYEFRAEFSADRGFAIVQADCSAFLAHDHPGHRVNLLLEGTEREWLKGCLYHAGAGMVTMVPAGERHKSPKDYGPLRFLSVAIPPDVPIGKRADLFRQMILAPKLWRLIHSVSHAAAPPMIESAFMEVEQVFGGYEFPNATDARWFRRVVERIMDAPLQVTSLQDLANSVGVHRCHLAKTVKARFGCTPGELVTARRLQLAARELQHSSDPIATVALRNGFYDQSHFGRLFRREYGFSPNKFRHSFSL